jgi:Transposase DDE domain group 1
VAPALIDHDHLRHDPVLAVLAGKSTLNRLELSRETLTRSHKISHDPARIERLFVSLFLEAHRRPPAQIVLDLDATDEYRFQNFAPALNNGSPHNRQEYSPSRSSLRKTPQKAASSPCSSSKCRSSLLRSDTSSRTVRDG